MANVSVTAFQEKRINKINLRSHVTPQLSMILAIICTLSTKHLPRIRQEAPAGQMLKIETCQNRSECFVPPPQQSKIVI